jgi:hypothetical protein
MKAGDEAEEDTMRKSLHGETTVLLDGAWRGLPPPSTEPGMESLSVPVRTVHGDPDNPRHGIARFDYLVGWVHSQTLEPMRDDGDVLWWELLPDPELSPPTPIDPKR